MNGSLTLRKKRIAWVGFLLLLFLISFLRYEHRAPKRRFCDFHVPYITGQRLLSHQDIYTFEGDVSYFKYPPFYAFLMGPLSVLTEQNAARLWHIFSWIFLCALFYCCRKLIIPHGAKHDFYLLYFFTVFVSFRFILQNLDEGQANIFMLALLFSGLYLISRGRENQGSFLLAFSMMTKYMPILFLPYFLIKRRYGLILKIAVFILILSLLPAFSVGLKENISLIGKQMNFLFASSLDSYSITCYPNQSILACLSRFFSSEIWYRSRIVSLSNQTIFILFIIICLALYTICLWPKSGRFENVDLALLCICMALFNPNAWKNAFVVLIFPYMLVIDYLLKRRFADRVVSILFFLSFVLNSMTSEFWVYAWAGDNFEIFSSVTFGTLLLFGALLKMKIRPLVIEGLTSK